MLKKIISFYVVVTTLTFLVCSCSNDKDNPLPAILFTNSATFNFKGVEQTKMVATSKKDSKNNYIQTGTSGSSGIVFNITFADKPTKDTTVDLSASGLKVTLTVVEGTTTIWNASTGIINTTVKDGITTSTFNSIDFTNLAAEHAIGTGSITTKD